MTARDIVPSRRTRHERCGSQERPHKASICVGVTQTKLGPLSGERCLSMSHTPHMRMFNLRVRKLQRTVLAWLCSQGLARRVSQRSTCPPAAKAMRAGTKVRNRGDKPWATTFRAADKASSPLPAAAASRAMDVYATSVILMPVEQTSQRSPTQPTISRPSFGGSSNSCVRSHCTRKASSGYARRLKESAFAERDVARGEMLGRSAELAPWIAGSRACMQARRGGAVDSRQRGGYASLKQSSYSPVTGPAHPAAPWPAGSRRRAHTGPPCPAPQMLRRHRFCAPRSRLPPECATQARPPFSCRGEPGHTSYQLHPQLPTAKVSFSSPQTQRLSQSSRQGL